MKKISIIIPAYNEEKSIPIIYNDLVNLWKDLRKFDYEIIFIDDGSIDNSWREITKIAKINKNVKGIGFSRNFGHQAAIEAGLKTTKGEAVIMLDCDGQHPVELIKKMLEKWRSGVMIVNTIRMDHGNVSLFKKLTAKLFYSIINIFSEIKIQPGTADFRLLDKSVVTIINNLSEHDKFYRGLVNWVGFKSDFIKYNVKGRKYGKSSYTFKKMLNLARVGITSFSLLPLKIIISLGLFISIASAITLAIMFYYRWFVNLSYFSPMAFLAVIIVFSNGIILTVIGIIAIYLVTIYKEVQSRPTYIVSVKVNL